MDGVFILFYFYTTFLSITEPKAVHNWLRDKPWVPYREKGVKETNKEVKNKINYNIWN